MSGAGEEGKGGKERGRWGEVRQGEVEGRRGVERRGQVEGSGPSATRIQSSVGY